MPNDDPHDSWHNPKSGVGRGFVGFWRSIYRPLGFQKGYNFPLFVILVGGLMGFVLARLQYLSIDGIFKPAAIPGEWFWYQSGFRRIGIILHLVTILPAGFLVCFQFVPVIRHKVLIFHRINGYFIILLFFFSIAGILMITRHAVGGSPNTQAAIGTLSTVTTISLCMAYYNVKHLQIDQHRAWMIRTWVYAGTIISLRLIMLAANRAVYAMNDYYDVAACQIIFNEYSVVGIPNSHNPAFKLHPNCPSGDLDGYVAVHANKAGPEGAAAATNLTFGMSMWIALVIHAIGVEIYLRLTPAESERLRVVSYERQLEAGFKNPGSAGLTVDRFGDAPRWHPPTRLGSEKNMANSSNVKPGTDE